MKSITRSSLMDAMNAFKPACVLGAAAELGIFEHIGTSRKSAEEVSRGVASDLMSTTVLLDALSALGLLRKDASALYEVHPSALKLLSPTHGGESCMLPFIFHTMNVQRGWTQIAEICKTGSRPAPKKPSVRGAASDSASFVSAMHTISSPVADELIAKVLPFKPIRHLLDVGGATGTFTIAFLRALPDCRATIFDLPVAAPLADSRVSGLDESVKKRIRFVGGDFYVDDLPRGADFAWLSAIVHQNDREQNRQLFKKVAASLEKGGVIGIRDFVMDSSRTQPTLGALFAINMLVNTKVGGTFTFEELEEDLKWGGFKDVRHIVKTEDMNAVVIATLAEEKD